jgi:hypothetical protein
VHERAPRRCASPGWAVGAAELVRPVGELRRLMDDGNENAADRLAELAADRGDLEELQRLSDDGNEKLRVRCPN